MKCNGDHGDLKHHDVMPSVWLEDWSEEFPGLVHRIYSGFTTSPKIAGNDYSIFIYEKRQAKLRRYEVLRSSINFMIIYEDKP